MSVTILEALENADFNIQSGHPIGAMFAKGQLHNAVVLLRKGYSLYETIDSLLEQYPNVEDAPDKDSAR